MTWCSRSTSLRASAAKPRNSSCWGRYEISCEAMSRSAVVNAETGHQLPANRKGSDRENRICPSSSCEQHHRARLSLLLQIIPSLWVRKIVYSDQRHGSVLRIFGSGELT